MYDAIVVGGGQAGLATGYHLTRKKLRYLILDANETIGGSWVHYYENLKLFSPARYSSLPGMKFPGNPERYPTKHEVIQYLRDYAKKFKLPVKSGERVVDVTRQQDGTFIVSTEKGDTYPCRAVIAASGPFHKPFVPEIPGMDQYKGQILHSFDYSVPEPFVKQRVIVVGAGNSAVQIAVELAKTSNVTLAVRTPVKFRSQRKLGKDLHFWLRVTGIDTLPLGYWNKVPTPTSVIDSGNYKAALASGRPDQRSMFNSFTASGVQWSDGSVEDVDTVIFATGYLPNYPYLANLNALSESGQPQHRGGVSSTVKGLYFVGLSGQRSISSATLRGAGSDAKYIVKTLQRYLKSTKQRGVQVDHSIRTTNGC